MEKEAIVAQYLVRANYLKALQELSLDRGKMKLIPLFMSTKFEEIINLEEFVVKLFWLRDFDQSDEINNYLFEKGFRPAFFKEMLAFLQQYPEFKKIPMVALHSSSWFNDREYFHPISYYDEEKGNWELGYQCFTCCLSRNNKKCWFLAVKL